MACALALAGTAIAVPLFAQNNQPTAAPFHVSYTIQRPDCQQNGSITLTVSDEDKAEWANFTFQATDAGGQPIGINTSDNVISSLPPGTYSVTVSARRITDNSGQRTSVTIPGITLTSDYVVLGFSENRNLTRGVYAGCGNGKIAMTVTGGKAPYRFLLQQTNSRAEVEIPAERYTLDAQGNFLLTDVPAGQYQLTAVDACGYSVPRTVEVRSYTVENGFPVFSGETSTEGLLHFNGYVWPWANGMATCNRALFGLYTDDATRNNVELKSRIEAGEFEVGLSTDGNAPQSWTKLDGNILTPAYGSFFSSELPQGQKISDFYGRSIQLFVRHNCSGLQRVVSVPVPQPTPFPRGTNRQSRGQYIATFNNFLFAGSRRSLYLYCYPATINIRQNNAQGLIVDQLVMTNEAQQKSSQLLNYGDTYYYEIVDANGRIFPVGTFSETATGIAGVNPPTTTRYNECDRTGWRLTYFSPELRACDYRITLTDETTGQEVETVNFSNAKLTQTSPKLEYGHNYKFYVAWNHPTLGVVGQEFRGYTMSAPSAVVTMASPSACDAQNGTLRVNLAQTTDANRRVTLWEGTRFVGESTSKEAEFDMKELRMPAGHYTLRVEEPGCVPFEQDVNWPGFHEVRDFAFTTNADCQHLAIIPHGRVLLNGQEQQDVTFRIVDGPASGYINGQQVAAGSEIAITQPGTYTLGIFRNTGCSDPLATLPIVYKDEPVTLHPNHSVAYACTGDELGFIFVEGQGGLPPYTYRLFDATDTQEIPIQPSTDSEGRTYYNYGHVGEKFHIRVKDACGTESSPELTLVDISKVRVAWAAQPEVCTGEDIQLQARPLFTYRWYRPLKNPTATERFESEPFSTEQNPIIRNARVEDSGTYRLVVKPPFCDKETEDFVTISVRSCYAPVNPHLMMKGNK